MRLTHIEKQSYDESTCLLVIHINTKKKSSILKFFSEFEIAEIRYTLALINSFFFHSWKRSWLTAPQTFFEYTYFNRKNTIQRDWHYLERTRAISSRRVKFDGGGSALEEIIVFYSPERGTQWNGDCNNEEYLVWINWS